MNTPAPYFHWHFVLISVPNLVLIGLMLALFALALVAPFPWRSRTPRSERDERG